MAEKSLNYIIATNLEMLMFDNCISQSELAEKIGVSQQTVSTWVNGYKIPRADKLDKICAVFHCTRSDLLNEKDPDAATSVDARIVAYAEKLAALPTAEFQTVAALIDALLLQKGGPHDD